MPVIPTITIVFGAGDSSAMFAGVAMQFEALSFKH
jgi:hypothetical protein